MGPIPRTIPSASGPRPQTGEQDSPIQENLDHQAMATDRPDGARPPWAGLALDPSQSFDGPGANSLVA